MKENEVEIHEAEKETRPLEIPYPCPNCNYQVLLKLRPYYKTSDKPYAHYVNKNDPEKDVTECPHCHIKIEYRNATTLSAQNGKSL